MRRALLAASVLGALVLVPAVAQAVSAPALTSLTQTSARHLKVTWSGQFMSPFVEVSASPDVDPTGFFTDQNAVNQPLDDFETSWESDAFAPGTYYVHVGGMDPGCLSCGFQFSATRSIRIGSAGAAPKPKPSLFSVLSVATTQRVGKLQVRAGMVTAGELAAQATVKVPGTKKTYRTKTASAAQPSSPGASAKLRLKLSAKALRIVKRALRRGAKLKAKVKVTASPAAGSAQSATRAVKLRP